MRLRRLPRDAAFVLAAGAVLVGPVARAQEVSTAVSAQGVSASAPEARTAVTVRASGGAAFVSAGYYCGYFDTYFLPSGGCGAGYATAQPALNLDVDAWLGPGLGISFGASVLWGSYAPGVTGVPPTRVYSTTWEPHVDVLLPIFASALAAGRVRLGLGLLLAEVHGLNTTAQAIHYTGVGGVGRVGVGVSLLPKSTLGVGVDALFEVGWMGGHYVSTIQLLLGPEVHF